MNFFFFYFSLCSVKKWKNEFKLLKIAFNKKLKEKKESNKSKNYQNKWNQFKNKK